MSNFYFDCPHCGQSLEAPNDLLGDTIDCPSCSGKIELPKPESAAPLPPPVPPLSQQQKTEQRQTVETNIKQGALRGGVVCFALGILMMCVSLWTVILYAPLFFASFVLSIVAIAQKRIVGGIILLIFTFVIPPSLLFIVPAVKAGYSAANKEVQSLEVSSITKKVKHEVTEKGAGSDSLDIKPEPQTEPMYQFNFASIPGLTVGDHAELKLVPAYIYNDVLKSMSKTELLITIEKRSDPDNLRFNIYNGNNLLILTVIDVEKLISIMEKYRDWNAKALAMDTKVEKEIGSFSTEIYTRAYNEDEKFERFYPRVSIDSPFFIDSPSSVSCKFFSQNKEYHQMVLQFDVVKKGDIRYEMDDIYLDSEGVNALLEAFSRQNIDKKVAEYEKQKKIESEFK